MPLWIKMPKVDLVKWPQAFKVDDEISVLLPTDDQPKKLKGKIAGHDNQELLLQIVDREPQTLNLKPPFMVHLMNHHQDKLLYTEGQVQRMTPGRPLALAIIPQPTALRAEQRLFYRFDIRRYFKLEHLHYPDGTTHPVMKAVCLDMSPTGIGFKSKQKIPRGAMFTPGSLFHPVIPDLAKLDYRLEVLWSKGSRWLGYRNGAIFKFSSPEEQERFNRVLDQLQINRLSWHYHNLEKPEPAQG